MASANQDVSATDATESVRLVNTPLWVPPFWAHNVTLWILVLKSQFALRWDKLPSSNQKELMANGITATRT